MAKYSKSEGFTLLETLVALFIIVLVVGAISSLLVQIIASVSFSSSQLTASYLAQEGLEIVRNIRDSNYLKQRSDPSFFWDEDIEEGIFGLDLNTRALPDSSCPGFGLKMSDGKFYECSQDSDAPFKRRVVILKTDLDGETETAEKIEASSTVEWQARGKTHSFTAQEHLYDWFK